MSTHEKLLPCPFCGGEAQFRKALWPSDGNTDAIIHAAPSECGLSHFDIGTTDESVIAAWNRRTPPAIWNVAHDDRLIDSVAAAIRGDGSDLCDGPWEALSDERKSGWRGDAVRAIAAVKEYLTTETLSAAPAAPNGWQPIETAPKDGTEFLGFGGGVEGVQGIQVVRWCEWVGCWETPEASLEDWDNQAEGYSRPTHWMPLPDAPTEAHD